MTQAADPREFVALNGIDGASGDYLTPPLPIEDVAKIARGDKLDPEHLDELRARWPKDGDYAPEEGKDPRDLQQVGWGVLFKAGADPAIREALTPLLAWRKEQAGDYYHEFIGDKALKPGETKGQFLARFGASPGQPTRRDKVPYYLLIVGDPESEIPFRLQYQLDIEYAVGRLHFDKLDDYAAYAQTVVNAEKNGLKLPRRMTFFGARNPSDVATQLSSDHLIGPLAQFMGERFPDWSVDSVLAGDATKNRLKQLLGGPDTPAMLFSASHGMSFPNGDARQGPHQGALLCQDWPGRDQWRQSIPQDFYFAGDDLAADARLYGLLAFFFACYGAGTPRLDDFTHRTTVPERAALAEKAFMANLPRRMLAHPQGGALAVVGHVERAWQVSFMWEGAGAQLQVFEDMFKRLFVNGDRLGYALEYFNQRYAALSADLSDLLYQVKYDPLAVPAAQIANLWTANNDARSYIIVGDPAVQLKVGESKERLPQRPVITITPAPQSGAPAGGGTQPQGGATPAQPQGGGGSTPYGDTGESYGISEDVSALLDKLRQSLRNFGEGLGTQLQKTVADAATLQVATYVADDVNAVKYDSGTGQFSGETSVRLVALTALKLDGDTKAIVPITAGDFDEVLWKVHLDLVRAAQDNRANMLKTLVSAASALLSSLGPKQG
jgi:hypothetical protein